MLIKLVLLVLARFAVVIFLLLGRVIRLFGFGCRSVVGISLTSKKIVYVSRVDDCVVKKYLAKGWKPIEVGGMSQLQERSRDNP
jgi:hypothetical protein